MPKPQTDPSPDSTPPDPAALHSPAQRAFALFWGGLCHLTFLIAISSMAIGLFSGMRIGQGTLEAGHAALANLALIAQFAVLHSILLSAKGRRWISRLPLVGIGPELSTTTFSLLSSLQILAVFLLWSPGGDVWFAPTGPLLAAWTLIYASTWLLLLKAMADSGLSLQTGALGWQAVWKNRRPEFTGYAMRGVYQFSRQPIYVAFSLILWTAPTWTLDHFLIASLWTLYCMIGPVFKEQRFRKFYGTGYRHYSATVPYWLPARAKRSGQTNATSPSPAETDFDVVIAGAGPVGMVLANLLGRDGHRVLVVEPRIERSKRSRAIGVTAPTLQTLEQIGILESCLDYAVPIGEAKVFGDDGKLLGGLSFDREKTKGSAAEVVSLPQRKLEQVLEKAMTVCAGVTYWQGREITSHRHENGLVTAEVSGENFAARKINARWMVACDGANSALRTQLQIPVRRKTYRCAFAMADFANLPNFGDEVRLFFTSTGAVETFPLPDGQRRWVVQLTGSDDTCLDDQSLLTAIESRATRSLHPTDRQTPWSRFVPERLLCDRFFHGRTILCGDAAHVMSPIGGHGMNVGVGDAIAAHQCLQQILRSDERDAVSFLRRYDRTRQKAFVRASRRAALGMWMGTRRGRLTSTVRALLLSAFLSSKFIRQQMADHFAMTADLGPPKISIPAMTVAATAPINTSPQ